MTKLEKEIERALVRAVERRGGFCLKWVCPGWAGVPDRIVLLPGGRVYFIEVKRPSGGRVGRLQQWWFHRLTDLGFSCGVAWDMADVEKFDFIMSLEPSVPGGDTRESL